ncbi:MAG: Gfo/Idh/MocA family oxidoreductase [Flavobacteriales bacterium]
MAGERLRVGVLGAGHLGRIHVQQWKELTGCQVVGIFDPHPEKREAVAQEFGVTALASMPELLAICDVVDVVTPTPYHFQCASAAMALGKHVFVEKPVTQTVEEALRLIDLAEEHNVKAQVGHVERFNPAFIQARPWLKDPMFIETHRLAEFQPRGTDVPVVLDLMIHDLDIVLNVVDSPVREVSASGVAVLSDSPDICNARIEFANGCVANLTASRISLKKMRKSRFFQRDAYIAVDMLAKEAEIVRMRTVKGDPDPFAMTIDLGEKGIREIGFEKPVIPATNAIREELRSFVEAIGTNKPTEVPLLDGYRALELAHRVLDAMETRTLV